MKKFCKAKTGVCLILLCALLAAPLEVYADDGVSSGYSYVYDYWYEIQYAPNPYSVVGVYTAKELGLEKAFLNPEGLFVRNNEIYVCDTGNNRVIRWDRGNDDSLTLNRIIGEVKGNVEQTSLSKPTDIFVDDNGYLYIADKGNERILMLDEDLNVLREYRRPTEVTFDASLAYLPSKLVVDSEGRVYCISDYVNKGIIKYETDGTFSGFYGAVPAKYDPWQYIKKRFLVSEEQRAKMENFVPTEYDNIALDREGFIYAVTMNVSGSGLDSGADKPLRKLNLLGNNILIENGYDVVMGDYSYGDFASYNGPSLFADVTVLDNDVYFCLDQTRGRLFTYDEQGNMLWIFGGVGSVDGCFKHPVALEHMDKDILVLDSAYNSLTIFTPTEFGDLVYEALDLYEKGDYIGSGETWEKVKSINGNYDQAYIGIGRSLVRQKKYREALPYFKTKWAIKQYTKAFKKYRKEWIEDNVWWIFTILAVVFIVPLIFKRIRFIKFQIDTAEIFKTDDWKKKSESK